MGEVYKARDTRLECTVAGSTRAFDDETFQAGCQATPRLHPMLFDWLVTGQVIPLNPAHSVRGPKHSVKKRKDVGLVGRGDGHPAQVHFGSG